MERNDLRRRIRTALGFILVTLFSVLGLSTSRTKLPASFSDVAVAEAVAVDPSCLQPPSDVTLTKDFYRAYQKLAVSSSSSSGSVNIDLPTVPLGFGMSGADRTTKQDLQTLTENDATKLVQKELSDHKVAIIAWCSYGLACQAKNADAVQAISEICNIAMPAPASGLADFGVRPRSVPLVFDGVATRETRLWLKLGAAGGVHATIHVAATFGPDLQLKLPAGVGSNDIVVSSDAPTQIGVVATRPDAITDEDVEFDVIGGGNPAPSKKVLFRLIPSSEDLLPPAAVPCGSVKPNLFVYASDNEEHARSKTVETVDVALSTTGAVTRKAADSFAANLGGGEAELNASCIQVTAGKKTAATTIVDLDGRVHASALCCKGTGHHPGGGAAVYPRWASDISLPGLPKQEWTVDVSLKNGLQSGNPKPENCEVTLDPGGHSLTVTMGDTKAASFQALTPGNYHVAVDCEGPHDDQLRSQALALWAGGAGEVTRNPDVKVTISAKRN